MDVDFSEAMCYLVSGKGNNFYARILSTLVVRKSHKTEFCPSMMVKLESRYISLVYNEEWLAKTTLEQVVAVIEHEALHVVLEHLPRMLAQDAMFQAEDDKKRFRSVSPLAADMADNCMLYVSSQVCKDWVEENRKMKWTDWTPPYDAENGWVFPEFPPFKFPNDLTYEQYIKLLMDKDKESEQNGKDGKGDKGKFHDWVKSFGPQEIYVHLLTHEEWKAMTEGMTDEEKQGLSNELKQKVRNIVKKAVEEHSKSRGTVPAFLQELIEKLLKPQVIPWTQLLRDKVVNTKRWKWQRSICRPNRRKIAMSKAMPDRIIPFPGRSKDRAFSCVFCIDTSGSMGERELEIALSELEYLRRADKDIEITIIEADADIGKEYTIDARGEIDWSLSGRGGTDFNPALIRAREVKPDIVFYYTDGYAPAPEPESRVACPMVWLITPNGKCPDEDWGHKLEMVDK
jgi:predicted metal-dependent peptidase